MKKDAKRPSGQKIDGMYEGLPYEGPPLNIKSDDPPHRKPRLTTDVKIYVLDMSDPVHVDQYEKLLKEVALGWARISEELKEWIPRTETWKVFLRLMHMKYIQPEDMSGADK